MSADDPVGEQGQPPPRDTGQRRDPCLKPRKYRSRPRHHCKCGDFPASAPPPFSLQAHVRMQHRALHSRICARASGSVAVHAACSTESFEFGHTLAADTASSERRCSRCAAKHGIRCCCRRICARTAAVHHVRAAASNKSGRCGPCADSASKQTQRQRRLSPFFAAEGLNAANR